MSGLTYVDIFCGAGGSSIGLTEAGLELKLAANHWARAIETHSANFRDAEHLCADVSNYDMRRLPKTDVLWASPECTWHSPAGGRKRARAQLDLLDDYVPTDGGVRSRATMLDVIRAAEAHRYRMILVENVVEAADWHLFDWWLDGLRQLDYAAQFVSVSAAHVGEGVNGRAPQWRDRLYIVLNRGDTPAPDVAPRPLAWCESCGEDVQAVQSWKRTDRRRIGKYRSQYVYRCPNGGKCRHSVVEPYVLPAAAAIDWSDQGTRVGDRARPLAAATLRRIEAGLAMFTRPFATSVNHGGEDGRAYELDSRPLPSRTAKIGDGIVTTLRRNERPHLASQNAMATVSAGGRHHALICPPGAFYVKHFTPRGDWGQMSKDVRTEPLGAITASDHHSLVVPYRKGSKPYPAGSDALSTVATKEQHGLMRAGVDVQDCHFRMLKPREHLRAQRFPDSYVVTGNKSEQTCQAGNAVSANVAHWLGKAVIEALS